MLLSSLQALVPDFKILITSRPNLNLDTQFVGVLQIEISATHSDIGKFLEDRMQKDRRLNRLLGKAPDLKRDIVDGIQNKACGM